MQTSLKGNLKPRLNDFNQIGEGGLLNNLGIAFRHPCPHTHQQNDKSERKHKHTVETKLTSLAQVGLPLIFWWHAF